MCEFGPVVFWCDAESDFVDGGILEVLVVGAEDYGNILVLQCGDGFEFFIDVVVVVEEVYAHLELLLRLFAEVSERNNVPVVEHP